MRGRAGREGQLRALPFDVKILADPVVLVVAEGVREFGDVGDELGTGEVLVTEQIVPLLHILTMTAVPPCVLSQMVM